MSPPNVERRPAAHGTPSGESSHHRQAADDTEGSAPTLPAEPPPRWLDGDDARVRRVADRVDVVELQPVVRAALREIPSGTSDALRTVSAVARLRQQRRQAEESVAAVVERLTAAGR